MNDSVTVIKISSRINSPQFNSFIAENPNIWENNLFIWDIRSLFHIDFSDEGIREFAKGLIDSSTDNPHRFHAIIINKVEHGEFLKSFRQKLRESGLSAKLESFEDFESAFHWLKNAD